MKTNDQKHLELLYEQVLANTNDSNLLELEEEYARIIANHAIKNLTESMETRIQDRGKIKGERLGDLVDPKVEQAEQIFKNEPPLISLIYDNLVRYDVFSSLIYFTAHRAYDLKPKDIQTVFIYPQMLVQYSVGENKDTIPFLDKQALEEKLQKTIKEVFVVRYNECLGQNKHSKGIKQWSEWRKTKLKFKPVHDLLPELKGMF